MPFRTNGAGEEEKGGLGPFWKMKLKQQKKWTWAWMKPNSRIHSGEDADTQCIH